MVSTKGTSFCNEATIFYNNTFSYDDKVIENIASLQKEKQNYQVNTNIK